jgi:hypothetical protein
MKEQLNEIKQRARAAVGDAADIKTLEEVKVAFLGKKG